MLLTIAAEVTEKSIWRDKLHCIKISFFQPQKPQPHPKVIQFIGDLWSDARTVPFKFIDSGKKYTCKLLLF